MITAEEAIEKTYKYQDNMLDFGAYKAVSSYIENRIERACACGFTSTSIPDHILQLILHDEGEFLLDYEKINIMRSLNKLGYETKYNVNYIDIFWKKHEVKEK